jgi:hypothetical protein
VNAEHGIATDEMNFLQFAVAAQDAGWLRAEQQRLERAFRPDADSEQLSCPCGRITVDITGSPRRRNEPVLCNMRCMWSRLESPAHARLRARRDAKYERNAAGFSEAKAEQLRNRSYFGTGNSSDSSGTGDDCASHSSDDDDDDAPPTPTDSGH